MKSTKKYYSILFLFLYGSLAYGQHDFFAKADQFFNHYVENGKVAYQSIKTDPGLLNELTDQIGDMKLAGKDDNFVKAFYINTYNILTIKQVIDRYPIKGPMQVSGFFNQISHPVAGQKLTLDQLEKGILFAQYPDSRMHFALVCAALGCPPLAGFAFQPEKLDQQLDQITSKALNNDQFIQLDHSKQRVNLSQIFEWYRQDFLSQSNDLIDYINQFRSQKIPSDFKIRYYDYDWSLNDA